MTEPQATSHTGINETNIRAWSQALRSGDYLQGEGRLAMRRREFAPDGSEILGPKQYCCYGVACELAIADGVEIEVEERYRSDIVDYVYDGHTDFMPPKVVQWLGLQDCDEGRGNNPSLNVVLPDGTMFVATGAALNDGEADAPDGWMDEEGFQRAYLDRFDFDQIADAIKRTFLPKEGHGENSQPVA